MGDGEKITENLDSGDSSPSSDNEKEKHSKREAVESKIYRLFGREKPVHKLLGGAKGNQHSHIICMHACIKMFPRLLNFAIMYLVLRVLVHACYNNTFPNFVSSLRAMVKPMCYGF